MLFDTSFLIDLMRGDAGAGKKLKEVERSHQGQGVSAPSSFLSASGFPINRKRRKKR